MQVIRKFMELFHTSQSESVFHSLQLSANHRGLSLATHKQVRLFHEIKFHDNVMRTAAAEIELRRKFFGLKTPQDNFLVN